MYTYWLVQWVLFLLAAESTHHTLYAAGRTSHFSQREGVVSRVWHKLATRAKRCN
jgi:hypothetical protein